MDSNPTQDFAAGAKTFETQIGMLEFTNGYSSPETSELLYDRIDFQRAVQVYLWSLPSVSMRALHEEFVRVGGGKVNSLPIFENGLKPSTVVFTGNATTIYGFNAFIMERDQPVVIDVRAPALFAAGHVPGAINIPHGKLTARRMAEFPEGTTFVTYCAGPHCNGADKGALRLARLGLPVKKMIGGVTGWIDEGFELVPGEG